MIALQIEDLKDFTAKLLVTAAFDDFLFSKGTIVTATTVTIDGRLNKEFFDSDQLIDEQGYPRRYAGWAECRELAFQRIKGKKLPLSFHFVLLAGGACAAHIAEQAASSYGNSVTPDQIDGLFLNIQYANGHILCTTGVSLHTFTLDRLLEQTWDNYVRQLFQKLQIAVTSRD